MGDGFYKVLVIGKLLASTMHNQVYGSNTRVAQVTAACVAWPEEAAAVGLRIRRDPCAAGGWLDEDEEPAAHGTAQGAVACGDSARPTWIRRVLDCCWLRSVPWALLMLVSRFLDLTIALGSVCWRSDGATKAL